MTLRGLMFVLVLPVVAHAAEGARDELNAAMRSRADYDRGAQLFGQCASCHGKDANGDTTGSVPRIAGQHYRVLLKQLVDFRNKKREDFRMGELADRHHLKGPRELADVALYAAAQDRGGARGIGSGEFLDRGHRVFADRCSACHGVEGRGDDAKMIPRLTGQHYGYLVRQMYDAVDGRRPSMVHTHTPRVANLQFDEVRGVADYLSRLGSPALWPHPGPVGETTDQQKP